MFLLGRILFFVAVLVCGLPWASRQLSAQGVLIPLPKRQNMVFDHSGHLYITTSDGWVRRYNVSTAQLDAGYKLGGSLTGIDIAPDDSFLLVAATEGYGVEHILHRVDLHSGAIVKIPFSSPGETGLKDVVIGANGIALATPAGSEGPLRQIDLATNMVSARNDVPGFLPFAHVPENSRIHRNATGTHLLISEVWSFWKGGCFTYNAATNTFSLAAPQGGTEHAAISRDGTVLATGFRFSVSLDSSQDYKLIRVFSHLGAGVALDPLDDTLYAGSVFSNEIIAYDAQSFMEKFRLPVSDRVDYAGFGDTTGNLIVSPDGNYLALTTDAGVRVFRIRPQPQGSPPVFELPTDMVFDHEGKYLYIATFRGFIWPYNLTTGTLEPPYDLGGIINGIDIAPDDSYILAAQNYHGVREATFQKLDLQNGAITHIPYDLTNSGEDGSWDIAIASNGKAFATTFFGGSGDTSLRQIDLSTNAMTIRGDAPSSGSFGGTGTQIHRSADRSRLVFLDSRGSNGPKFSYNATSDTFGPTAYENRFWGGSSAAVSRDGNLTMWANDGSGGHLQTLPSFTNIYTFSEIDSGVAFDAVSDVVYGVSFRKRQIIAYDTNSFAEKFRLGIGSDLAGLYGQFDIGNLVASQDGHFLALTTENTLKVFNLVNGAVTALPTPAPLIPSTRLANISTRATVQTGDNVPIGGFIITGTEPKSVVVRGIGPSLSSASVQDALEDPTLEVYNTVGQVVASNDDWQDSQGYIFTAYSLAPSDHREAALYARLSPGAYTAVLRGKNQSSGVGLVELYDLQPAANSKLSNISTRAMVGTNDSVMIAGLIVINSNAKIFCRAIGPSLSQFGVAGALQDPILELHDGQGAMIQSNDDWDESSGASEIWNAGLQPARDAESIILTTVSPGNYTAIVRGKEENTGVGLVEIYQID